MDHDSNFSIILSNALDTLGYSFQAIQRRVKQYDNLNESFNETFSKISRETNTNISYILAGSKREGVSLSRESDYDQMLVLDDIQCTENTVENKTTNDCVLLRDNVPPGYTKIRSENYLDLGIDGTSDYFVFDPNSNTTLISSKIFMSNQSSTYSNYSFSYGLIHQSSSGYRAGPSIPVKITFKIGGEIDLDNVIALPCKCSDYISAFCSRDRQHRFPSHDQLKEISQMEGHVVPVGQKGSDDQDLQWRICYTLVEIKLIQNFNATQYQLYVVLKMLSKSVLKPVCPDITSYIIKNIVLWIIEITPRESFQKVYLTKLIARSLLFMKMLISGGYIPNYMIPVRNLLAIGMQPSMKLELVASLSRLLDESESMVLNCPELRTEMSILFNTPNSYESRLEERNIFDDYATVSMVSTYKQLAFKKFESLKAFSEEFLKCLPVEHLPKMLKRIAKIPGYIENIAYLLNKPLVVDAVQQLTFTTENIASIGRCFLPNTSKERECMSSVFEKATELLDMHPELTHDIMHSDELFRMLENVVPDDTPLNELGSFEQSFALALSNPKLLNTVIKTDLISKCLKSYLPYISKMVSENKDGYRDMIRSLFENNLIEAIGEDNLNVLLSASFRCVDIAEVQRAYNNPAVYEFITKMFKGKSM